MQLPVTGTGFFQLTECFRGSVACFSILLHFMTTNFCCKNMLHFAYPFPLMDILSFLTFGCYKHLCTSFCVYIYCYLSWDYTKQWNCWVLWWLYVYQFEEMSDCFPNWCIILLPNQSYIQIPAFPIPCQSLLSDFFQFLAILVDWSYIHWSSDLYFPDD